MSICIAVIIFSIVLLKAKILACMLGFGLDVGLLLDTSVATSSTAV